MEEKDDADKLHETEDVVFILIETHSKKYRDDTELQSEKCPYYVNVILSVKREESVETDWTGA